MRVIVRRGDSLWYYSLLFDVPFPLVVDSNRGIDPNRLFVGQEINVPGFIAVPYTIAPGDTFWRIAQRTGIALDALYLLNLFTRPDALQVGQSISLPQRVTTPIVVGQRNYDYRAMMEDLQRLKNVYPFIVNETIGRSVMGKVIPEIRVGVGETRVHFNGSFHAQEWITTPILMQTLNEYLLALTNRRPIRGRVMAPFYENVMLSIVPMVNPDGVDLVIRGAPPEEPYRSFVLSVNQGRTDFSNWRANIRGVDLNNQYPALWQREAVRKPQAPAPTDFPGTAPLTEPESIAMAQLAERRDFDRVLAYHTQGKVIYWGFQGLEPPESELLVNEFFRVSGYVPIRYVDSYAGYKDWFIQQWRRPGFTVELGRGVNPLPLTQFNEIYEESLGIFLANLYMR
ncbi:LysM peptidoglycan-binding domain-containing protein [Heliorestis acidaminivorans]|uniref:LysM peptidoglycan-binding domain-containing protein n=1 Tax=Heliorestis acidaminivorans TaxID=553427 RepID=A0A6I0EZG1_9FIRM|nr:M14 family metallopeptidase [Heliorestis acidaminivorans]KAB2950944.1 LysM peptidoglycan-binding domain-containing protein [Heliorestis acidaminivorans]